MKNDKKVSECFELAEFNGDVLDGWLRILSNGKALIYNKNNRSWTVTTITDVYEKTTNINEQLSWKKYYGIFLDHVAECYLSHKETMVSELIKKQNKVLMPLKRDKALSSDHYLA